LRQVRGSPLSFVSDTVLALGANTHDRIVGTQIDHV